MPSSHSEAYTAPAWLCQKITATGLFFKIKFPIAAASGSENGVSPALTDFDCQVPLGCHLQLKLRLRSTSFALKRPEAKTFLSVATSAMAKRPSRPTTA